MPEKFSYKALIEHGIETGKAEDINTAIESQSIPKRTYVINQGINSFKGEFRRKHKQLPTLSTKVSRLSKTLAKSHGLTDKKGIAVHTPEPILKWEHRKEVVLKKMKKR